MDFFVVLSALGIVVVFGALFFGFYTWNNSLAPDHTRISPLSRSIAQSLLVVIVFSILVFTFFF